MLWTMYYVLFTTFFPEIYAGPIIVAYYLKIINPATPVRCLITKDYAYN